jgi:cytosine/adenosine deaminase-related metal-dependent hydrolase
LARELDLWASFDGGGANPMLPGLYRDGLLVGHESFNHGGGILDANWQVIRERGAKVNVTPRSDSQFFYGGNGTGINAIQDALDHGVRPGISNDNPSAYAIDMFEEMRTVYAFQRGLAQNAKFKGNANPPAPIAVRDVLEFATIRGADCCGLSHKCGSLTPGKEADLVMIRTNNIHLYSMNAIGAVVQSATVGHVDTVFIAGQVRKWRGKLTSKLVGRDLGRVRQLADESRNHLLTAAGWQLDIFSD